NRGASNFRSRLSRNGAERKREVTLFRGRETDVERGLHPVAVDFCKYRRFSPGPMRNLIFVNQNGFAASGLHNSAVAEDVPDNVDVMSVWETQIRPHHIGHPFIFAVGFAA